MRPHVTGARVRAGFTIDLEFADGSQAAVDLEPWIRGRRGVFEALQDPVYFARVAVDSDAGTIVWPNGADIDPDVLWEAAHGMASPPELPPAHR